VTLVFGSRQALEFDKVRISQRKTESINASLRKDKDEVILRQILPHETVDGPRHISGVRRSHYGMCRFHTPRRLAHLAERAEVNFFCSELSICSNIPNTGTSCIWCFFSGVSRNCNSTFFR